MYPVTALRVLFTNAGRTEEEQDAVRVCSATFERSSLFKRRRLCDRTNRFLLSDLAAEVNFHARKTVASRKLMSRGILGFPVK